MTPSTAKQRRLAYLAWTAVCLLWGTTYMFIRISLETMPPALMGGLRWFLAGGLLAGYLKFRGVSLPPPSRWGPATVMGLLLLGLGNGGVVFAEQWIPSGLVAVLVASAPFWMVGIEAFLPDGEKLSSGAVVGLVIGFSGIVYLVWPELSVGVDGHSTFLAGVIAVQIAALGWSLGSAYSKRHARNENVLATTALQMLAGGFLMIVAGTVRGEWGSLSFNARTAGALTYLTTIGSIGGFVAYTYALRHLPTSFVSLYAYINPIIAVTLGVLLLHEPFTARMAFAAALVFAGVGVVRWVKASPSVRAATTDERPAGAARRIA